LFLSDPINFLIVAARRFCGAGRRSLRALPTLTRALGNYLHPPFGLNFSHARVDTGWTRNTPDTFRELFWRINQDKAF
jgi:hypothetical protein